MGAWAALFGFIAPAIGAILLDHFKWGRIFSFWMRYDFARGIYRLLHQKIYDS
ncbi:hypothetical protein QP775_02225 [Paenibacillus sp. UMB4589-SE434]|nr:hypothetical protein [Paenibacillus sp. UMB4589-SE434]